MDEEKLVSTRRALHGVAELILAGPEGPVELAGGTFRARAQQVGAEARQLDDVLGFFLAGQDQAAKG